jgi:hypothetical protein
LIKNTFAIDLIEISLIVLLVEGEAKSYLNEAKELMSSSNFIEALIAIRKAIFIEFEEKYSIYRWHKIDKKDPLSQLGLMSKAPSHTRDREWIENSVKDPFDYLQIDPKALTLELLEMNISTENFWNL